jgi:hypothetical protein
MVRFDEVPCSSSSDVAFILFGAFWVLSSLLRRLPSLPCQCQHPGRMNGGPGASSLAGCFSENGPLLLVENNSLVQVCLRAVFVLLALVLVALVPMMLLMLLVGALVALVVLLMPVLVLLVVILVAVLPALVLLVAMLVAVLLVLLVLLVGLFNAVRHRCGLARVCEMS